MENNYWPSKTRKKQSHDQVLKAIGNVVHDHHSMEVGHIRFQFLTPTTYAAIPKTKKGSTTF